MTGLPLIIAFVVAIVLMILLISKLKVHPFLAIMAVSLLLAIVAGIPLKDIPGIIGQAQVSSIFSTARKASLGTWTVPNWRMRFLPSFCFSRSFFFRVISPP